MAIKGKLSTEGSFTVDPANDPALPIRSIVWIEQKEPTLTRPMLRCRMRVVSRNINRDGSITYDFRSVASE